MAIIKKQSEQLRSIIRTLGNLALWPERELRELYLTDNDVHQRELIMKALKNINALTDEEIEQNKVIDPIINQVEVSASSEWAYIFLGKMLSIDQGSTKVLEITGELSYLKGKFKITRIE